MRLHTGHQDHSAYSLLPALRHWGPMLLFSLVVNIGLFMALGWLFTEKGYDSPAGKPSRLAIILVGRSLEQQDVFVPPEKSPIHAQNADGTLKTTTRYKEKKTNIPAKLVQPKEMAQAVNKSQQPAPKTMPSKTMPSKTTSSKTMPSKTTSSKTTSSKTIPSKTIPSSVAATDTTVEKNTDGTGPAKVAPVLRRLSGRNDVQIAEPDLAISPPATSTSREVVPLSQLTRMPKLLSYDEEAFERYYPPKERQFGKEATVEAMILVDEEGEIREVKITKSAGPNFDAAAKEVILSKVLTIEPGYIGNQPVASRLPIPIVFHLVD